MKLQITPRFARDLLDDLVERDVADRREVELVAPGAGAANMYWFSDEYTAADVEALLGSPEPEINPTDKLNDAISD